MGVCWCCWKVWLFELTFRWSWDLNMGNGNLVQCVGNLQGFVIVVFGVMIWPNSWSNLLHQIVLDSFGNVCIGMCLNGSKTLITLFLQGNVIFSLGIGFQILLVQFTMRAAPQLKVPRIVWRMGGLIQGIYTGSGVHEIVQYQSLSQRNFLKWWGTSIGHWLVIRSLVTMFSHCCACSPRYTLELLCLI